MGAFEIALVAAALLCGLVAGFLFGFAVVGMPGIGTLPDGQFLRAFKAMDRVIQDNQPLFMIVWVGSVLALIGAVALGFGRLDGLDLGLLLAAAGIYLAGVQAPTGAVNVPLNNRLQRLDLRTMSEADLAAERSRFESRWNRWNGIRTVLAVGTTLLLLVILLRL